MLDADEIGGRAMNEPLPKGTRVLDPDRDGRVARNGTGLIDLHTHVYRGGTSITAIAPARPATSRATGSLR